MAKDAGKAAKYARILSELEKFSDPANEQRLELVAKSLAMSKQNLNYYLKIFLKAGMIEHVQEQPFSIYTVTGKGLSVKENLIQSEPGVKTVTWRYHHLIVLYKVFTWGSWRFGKTVPMNNWRYQIVKIPNGLTAHVHDTGAVKIYGPKLYGPDGEVLRIRASSMAQEGARWFVDHYNMTLGDIQIKRKGQKELLNSEQLAKLLGRVKTDEFFVDASGGDDNLEEPDDSFAVENILSTLQETPGRLGNLEKGLDKLGPTIQDLSRNMELHLEVMGNINTGISELRTAVQGLSAGSRVSEPSHPRERRSMAHFERRSGVSGSLVDYIKSPEPKLVEIKITRETPQFSHDFRGAGRIVGPFMPGAIIWLPGETAAQLEKEGYAQRIQEDTASTE